MMNNWFDSQTVHVAVDDENDNYPIQDDIRTGESGQGYVLRMTRSNFLPGLSEIRKRCGKQITTSLTSIDAPFVAKWFGADPDKLKAALEEIDPKGNAADGRYLGWYAGQQIPRQNFLNRMAPRVCPDCLAEDGICRIGWDFSFVTACPRHEKLLIDQCPGCTKLLSWQRPAVDICSCGTYLSDHDLYVQEPAPALELEVSRWMIDWIDGVQYETAATKCEAHLPKLIKPLSMHGGMHMLWILSVADESKGLKNVSVIDGTVLERCRKTLLRADEFCKKLSINDPETFRSKKRQTLIPQLALFMHKSYTYEDRSLAQSLISTILRASGKYSKTIGGLHVQPSLFSD